MQNSISLVVARHLGWPALPEHNSTLLQNAYPELRFVRYPRVSADAVDGRFRYVGHARAAAAVMVVMVVVVARCNIHDARKGRLGKPDCVIDMLDLSSYANLF